MRGYRQTRRALTHGEGVARRRRGKGGPRNRQWREIKLGRLRRALDNLGKGDVLIVTRLARLARSTRDLLNTLASIADRGAGFRSLGDACRQASAWCCCVCPFRPLPFNERTLLSDPALFPSETYRATLNRSKGFRFERLGDQAAWGRIAIVPAVRALTSGAARHVATASYPRPPG
jgi:Resolvase, N terminal domain